MRWVKNNSARACLILTVSAIGLFFPVRYVLGFSAIYVFGIGDGHPPFKDKIIGLCIALAVASVYACLLSFAIYALFLSMINRIRSRTSKTALLIASGALIGVAWFISRASVQAQAIQSNIYMGNIDGYESAVRWRLKGSIDDDLYYAAYYGQPSLVQRLIAKGANVNARLAQTGLTVLEAAKQNGRQRSNSNEDIIQYLKNHGAIEPSQSGK